MEKHPLKVNKTYCQDLNKMTEKEFDEWLSKTDLQKDISTYKLCPPLCIHYFLVVTSRIKSLTYIVYRCHLKIILLSQELLEFYTN